MTAKTDPPDVDRWWKNKRRLAWTGMIALLALAVLAILRGVDTATSDLLQAIAYVFGAVICAYIGMSGYDDMKARNK